MEHIVNSLLYRSNITAVNKQDLYLQLLSHNEYPSIKAVTDTLDYFGIDNIAANVPTDALAQMPKDFLALLNENGQTKLILVKKKPSKIQYTDQENKKHKITYDDFSKKWNGTIIAIEKEEKKIGFSLDYIQTLPLAATCFILVTISMALVFSYSLTNQLYLLLAILGILISYLTIKEELGIKNKVTTKVCGAISGDVHGCSNVINSREGKIFGVISLADTSLLFFTSTFFSSLFFGLNTSIIYALTIASMPVVLFSIYLQTFKLKQFCLLCLFISAILIAQLFLLFATFNHWYFSWIEFVQFCFVLGLTTIGWLAIKKLWKRSNLLTQTQHEYYSFKRNGDLFLSAIQNQRQISRTNLQPEHGLSFGNENAPIKIIAITNPLCGFCKEPFEVYYKLLNTHPEDILVTFLFNISSNPENPATQIASKVIALYRDHKSLAWQALQEWFKTKNMEQWLETYKEVDSMSNTHLDPIKSHRDWCNTHEINYTPETFINNYRFPAKQYKISDLPYFLEELKRLIPLPLNETTYKL